MSDLSEAWKKYAISVNNYKDLYLKWNRNRCQNIGTIDGISESLQEYGNRNDTVRTGSVLTGLAGGTMAVAGLIAAPFTVGASVGLVAALAAGTALAAGSAAVNISVKILEASVSRRKCEEAKNVVIQDNMLTSDLKNAEIEHARCSAEFVRILRDLKVKDPQKWQAIQSVGRGKKTSSNVPQDKDFETLLKNLNLVSELEAEREPIITSHETIDAPVVDPEIESKDTWKLPASQNLQANHGDVISFFILLYSFLTGLIKILAKSQIQEKTKLLKTYSINLTEELHSMEDNEVVKWLITIEIDVNLFQSEFWTDLDGPDDSEKALLDMGLGFLQNKVDIVRTVRGKPSIIRAVYSDVALHTPNGLYAIVLGNIHTNHSAFKHHVQPNECIVGPICEYKIEPLPYSPQFPKDAKFMLKIPHIIRDVQRVKHLIRVRHGDIHSRITNLKLETPDSKSDVHYDVDERFVTIYTNHFSGFIVSVEDINCCSGSANVLLFGSLKNVQDERPLTTLKVYFSGAHSSKIRDYELALRNKEALFNRHILTTKEMLLSMEPYDPTKSQIRMNIEPDNQDVWTPHRSSSLRHECQLNEALKYNDGHICKRNPTDVVEFYLESSEERATHYRGIVEVILNVAVTSVPIESGASTASAEAAANSGLKTSSFKILTDIQNKMSQSAAHRGQVSDGLTPRDLSKLARKITPENLRTIALELLDYEVAELETLATSRASDIQQFKFDVLYNWTNKGDGNNRLRLISILEEAAVEGLVDHAVSDEVLRGSEN